MNLRPKPNTPEVNTIVKNFFATVFTVAVVSLPILSKAQTLGSNVLSLPMALSFPTAPDAIEKSIVRFGNDRLKSGFEVSQNLDDVIITDPFALKLSGVKFKGHVKGRLDRDENGLIVEAAVRKLALTIDRISIHTVVKSRVSGVDANIRIDAECTGSVISWPEQTISFFARGRLNTTPTLAIDLSGLALPADLEKPEMILSCTGPFGIDGLIREHAWTAIQDRWTDRAFAKEIETKIEESFAAAVAIGGTGLNLVNQPGLRATMFTERFETAPDAGHLLARLKLEMDRPVSIPAMKENSLELPKGKMSEVTLSLPVAAAENILRAWLTPGVWSNWIEGQSVDGFRDLMSSRFKQIIAFPDLQNYPKDAPFWFALDIETNPSVQCSNGKLLVQAPAGAWMLLKDSSLPMGYKPMVRFSIETHLAISLPQKKVSAPMSANVDFMDLSYKFDARYIATENPNTIIAGEQIRDEVADYLQSHLNIMTSVEGFVGETAKALNQTNMSCDFNTQMIRIVLPEGL